MNIKKASITTLGFICEVLFSKDIKDLGDDVVQQILEGIALGIQKYGDLSSSSLKALGFSLSFLKAKLQDEKVLKYILESLTEITIAARKQMDTDVINLSISCLEEICREFYAQIP